MPILRVCARRSSLHDLGEQAEQGNHNLGLQVLLSLEVDAFLDGGEADFTLHQFIDDVESPVPSYARDAIARSQSAGLRALSAPACRRYRADAVFCWKRFVPDEYQDSWSIR